WQAYAARAPEAARRSKTVRFPSAGPLPEGWPLLPRDHRGLARSQAGQRTMSRAPPLAPQRRSTRRACWRSHTLYLQPPAWPVARATAWCAHEDAITSVAREFGRNGVLG